MSLSSLIKGSYNLISRHHPFSIAGSNFRSLIPIFLTAGQRISLGLVSVPVWLIVLSDQLKIIGLVSF